MAEVDRKLTREVHHPSFRRAVGDVPRCPYHPVLGGEVDDPTAHLGDRLLYEHLLDCALAAEEHPAEADGHDRVPVLFFGLEQPLRMWARDDGVVHHDVEPACMLECCADEALDLAPPRDIRLHESGAPTLACDELVG